MDDLARAAASRRLTVIQGDVAEVHAEEGRLARIDVAANGARQGYDVDLLLVQAGLEYSPHKVTGLGGVVDPASGETTTPGVFVVGDAVPSTSRPPVISAGFSEAVRAAHALHERIAPSAARVLPHHHWHVQAHTFRAIQRGS